MYGYRIPKVEEMSTDPGTDRRSFLKQCTLNYIDFSGGKKGKDKREHKFSSNAAETVLEQYFHTQNNTIMCSYIHKVRQTACLQGVNSNK